MGDVNKVGTTAASDQQNTSRLMRCGEPDARLNDQRCREPLDVVKSLMASGATSPANKANSTLGKGYTGAAKAADKATDKYAVGL